MGCSSGARAAEEASCCDVNPYFIQGAVLHGYWSDGVWQKVDALPSACPVSPFVLFWPKNIIHQLDLVSCFVLQKLLFSALA